MRVAVIYTKYTDYAIDVMDNFYTSIKASGDEAKKVHIFKNGTVCEYRDINLNSFDLQIQICKHNEKSPSNNNLISDIRSWCQKSKTKKLIVDTEHHLPLNPSCKWFSVGFNDIKAGGEYYNDNSPADRWNELGVEIKPWKTDGKYILILGQHENGVSTNHLNIIDWFRTTIKELVKYKLPIKFRMHPNQKVLPEDCLRYFTLTHNTTLQQDLEDAICVVSRTTNALNYAVPMGIPLITPDQMSTAYPMASHDLDLDKLVRPDREQWCYNLAYTQWSTEEIKQGKCWNHIRKFV